MSRITPQQDAVLNYLIKSRAHPTAAQVCRAIRVRMPRVSRATIYRNLDRLMQRGKIRSIGNAGTTRFEAHLNHNHFVCTTCHTIIDLHPTRSPNALLADLKKQHPKLQASEVMISYSGLCQRCAKRGGTHHGRTRTAH